LGGSPRVTTRRPLLEAGTGAQPEAFGAGEWLLLWGVALIWRSSFLFIEFALDALRPGVIALRRVLLGTALVLGGAWLTSRREH